MGKVRSGQFTPGYIWNYLQLKKKTCQTTIIVDNSLLAIDISMTLATRFALNYQDPSATLFLITLKEIDHEIQDYQVINQYIEATNQELVAYKLLAKHQDLVDVFSKSDSDELPPHCTIDHKIVLA